MPQRGAVGPIGKKRKLRAGMTAKLQLYRFIEDAWNDGIRDWCKRASWRSIEGWQCWMIVANRGQTRWFKQQSLTEGMTSFGLHYLEPHMLRRELCALLGVDAQFPGDETLEFLLKVEALRRSDPESVSVSRNPTACLHALSEIASAGWHQDVSALKTMPLAADDFFAALQKSKSWTPDVDRELMGRAAKKRLMCCVVGWDAGNWQQINLLDAATRSSEECEVYVPMPRAQGEKLHHDWCTALESLLGVASAACKAGGFESGNEGLVERLEGADLNKPGGAKPEFLIGQEWRDEMQLVRDHVLRWLDSAGNAGRLAIVVPRRSPSSMQTVRALADAGIELLDETGERQEAPLDTQIQRQIVRYHLLGCDVDALLDLVALLHQRAPEACIDPTRARVMLHRRFAEVQSRNARLIVSGADGPRELAGIVEKLGRWEDEITWAVARKQWENCLREFVLNTDILEPLWSQVGALFGKRKIPARPFLEYLGAMLSGSESRSAAPSAFARVVVTTFSRALHQTWDKIIFLDANEGAWPTRQEENPFLDDATRSALNRRRSGTQGHLLLSSEQSSLEQSRFLDLVEHCAGGIIFAATARDPGDPSREAYPNEWAIRVLAESGSPDAWREQIAVCASAGSRLADGEEKHLKTVHASRRDPLIPFDRYLFSFHESGYEASWWSATDLDAALTRPATCALKEIFDAESSEACAFERAENWVVGRLTHAWLARVLGGGGELAPFEMPDDSAARLEHEREKTECDIADLFASENLALPLWWKSALRKSAWVARNCLAVVLENGGARWFSMEKNLRAEIETLDGVLKVKGRIDLLFADQADLNGASLRIIDFKTGAAKIPTLAQLQKGNGFQFAAYFLMAKSLGAARARVLMIHPERGEEEVFSDEYEVELRELMGRLARLQRDLKFGQLGPLLAEWGASESLPMATTPIDPWVLDQKANLVLLAE
jgi:RecB family exonuclease